MSCGATHHIGVFVVHFALNYSLAEGPVIFSRRNIRLPFLRRIEARMRHAQWRKDFLSRKKIQRQICFARQHFSEQDEPNVAVLGTRARRCDQPGRERRANQFFARLRELKQLLVSWQSTGVRKKHVNGDHFSRRLLMPRRQRHELRQESRQWRVKHQTATVIKQHRHSGRRDNFRYGSEIEDGFGLYLRCAFIIGKVAKSLRGNQRSTMRDGERRAGEGALRNSVANDGKRPRKPLFLIRKSRLWRGELV